MGLPGLAVPSKREMMSKTAGLPAGWLPSKRETMSKTARGCDFVGAVGSEETVGSAWRDVVEVEDARGGGAGGGGVCAGIGRQGWVCGLDGFAGTPENTRSS